MFEVLSDRELETLDYMMFSARKNMARVPESKVPYGDADPWDDATDVLIAVMREERRRDIRTFWPKMDELLKK